MLETADVPSSATNRLSEHHRDDHDDNFCDHDYRFCDHDDDHLCDIGPDRQHGDGVGHNLQKVAVCVWFSCGNDEI